MSFSGGIETTLVKVFNLIIVQKCNTYLHLFSILQTNTFQIVLATDEVYTYAIFNYVDINWSSHTEAGGDTVKGEGGISAYVRVFSNNHQ